MKEASFRVSTLMERKRFYEKEFSLARVKNWFHTKKLPLPQICALDAGTDSKVMKKRSWNNTLFYVRFDEMLEKALAYLPEDIYYDRNQYDDVEKVLQTLRFPRTEQQELAFDVDANNISCTHAKVREVCEQCLKKVLEATRLLVKELRERFQYQNIALTYSGRGFHVHVLDEKAFRLSYSERSALARCFQKFPIDPWVTRSYIRLLRVPFTLNGVVSRIATPLTTLNDLSFRIRSIPQFLRR